MKKTKIINLVLITAALASCNKQPESEWSGGKKSGSVNMRADTTAKYSRVHSGVSPMLWFYAFRPYGMYYGGTYHHAGYSSSGISQNSNIGTSHTKSTAMRGGFGGRGSSSHSYSVGS